MNSSLGNEVGVVRGGGIIMSFSVGSFTLSLFFLILCTRKNKSIIATIAIIVIIWNRAFLTVLCGRLNNVGACCF